MSALNRPTCSIPSPECDETDCAARAIAAAERSTSSSVVAQFEIDTRSTYSSFQVVPPSQQVPSRWTAATAARLASSPPGRRTSTWLSTTSLTIRAPGISASRLAIRRACAQLRSIISATPVRPSERHRGVNGHDARTARALGHVVRVVALARIGHEIGPAKLIAATVSVRVGDDGHRAVVGHIEPLVRIDGPGVRTLDALGQVRSGGCCGGPQSERAVDVQPGAVVQRTRRRSVRMRRTHRWPRSRPGHRRSSARPCRQARLAARRAASGLGRRLRYGSGVLAPRPSWRRAV